MSGLPPVPPETKFHIHAVVNVKVDPPEVIDVRLTRKECREFIKWRPDADDLRIRRGRTTLYKT